MARALKPAARLQKSKPSHDTCNRLGDSDLRASTQRPSTVGECPTERPCPWAACKYHLAFDVVKAPGKPSGRRLKMNFPDLEVHDMAHTCALDEADRGGLTLSQVGERIGLTRERVRQIEAMAIAKLRSNGMMLQFATEGCPSTERKDVTTW